MICSRPSLTLLIIFLFALETFCQNQISGIVYNQEGQTLNGVNVVEASEQNSTITNANGQFSVNCSTAFPVLQFSLLGYITKAIKADSSFITIRMELDTAVIEEWPICLVLEVERSSKMGVSTGIHYSTVGFKLENFTPFFLHRDSQQDYISVASGVEWRANNNSNQSFMAYLNPHRLIRKSHDFGFYGQYKHFKVDKSETREWILAPEIDFMKFKITAGYVYQYYLSSEQTRTAHGVQASFFRYLTGYSTFRLSASYVMKLLQCQSNLLWHIPKIRTTVGITYERIQKMNEMSLALLYKINY